MDSGTCTCIGWKTWSLSVEVTVSLVECVNIEQSHQYKIHLHLINIHEHYIYS